MDSTKDNSNYSDHDLLIELRTEIRGMREDIRKQNDGVNEAIKDHETRLRSIEKYVWLAIGGLALLEILVTIYVAYKSIH